MLIRFKRLGVNSERLLTVYLLKIRTLLEYATPCFHNSLTVDQSNQLETTQKKALAIIVGNKYTSYDAALKLANIERIDARRNVINLNFAKKCVLNPRHSHMFPTNPNLRPHSRHPKPFKEHRCNTTRVYKSLIPSMARLLNKKQVVPKYT
jgi:hypothetical protein